ncbi:choice-of-anchor E domain-containing protein [Actibacterium sp. 188UL27-1]|uniref:choice-of-anchor E domain-containing protein n=1 Tax=Actibacterium sp. 188UL27-1 TaxID=2786961 RepID=UPI00195F189A|nr:choice-of-anchor E domain-containing protein [Actibacterium sp. 188UL27-1]MBM7066319.1 VPLPA-CTERM sorting domain-containing protein [Actibacterium sp. 188UL27-1]
MFLRMLVAGTALLCATSVSAATVSYSDSISLQTTNWEEQLSLPQFDTTFGFLNSVTLTLTAMIEGGAAAESKDAAASTVVLDLSATLTAATNLIPEIAKAIPLVVEQFNATAFDGTVDYAGSSGLTLDDLQASDSGSGVVTGSDLDEFIGDGTVEILLTALGTASGTGSGNLSTDFNMDASAAVEITYDYTPSAIAVVPLPAGAVLMLTGLGAVGFVGRRRRLKGL